MQKKKVIHDMIKKSTQDNGHSKFHHLIQLLTPVT